MDLVKAVQGYLTKMTSEVSGMKVLLLDKDTTPIISVVVTQSQLLAREIYLIDRVDNRNRERMRHLKCIMFLRPTPASVQALIDELHDPSYGDYYLYFSNTIQKSSIERLAEADTHEVVREVQEYFADFLAVNPDLFSLNVATPEYPLFVENSSSWDTSTLARVTEGVCSVLLALKKKPLIRYERNSALARKLAAEISYTIQNEGPLFDFRKPDTPPILLLLDRRNDPVTPLLLQWTYQALVHELLGITNGRVDLSDVPDIRPEMKEVVLSQEHDQFYAKNMFLNLGDLGANIKSYVDDFQQKHNSTKNIESITDMKRFVEEYPEFRKLSGNVSKHVTLVGELTKRVERGSLLEASELEQSLACTESHSSDVKTLQRLINDPNMSDDAKLRLALLYALRYEKLPGNALSGVVSALQSSGMSERKLSLVPAILQYAGTDQRLEDIMSNSDLISRTKNVLKGLKGVENVYTQHTPHIVSTLTEAIKGKLKEQNYPFLEGSTRDKPQDLIVFVIGGTTFAEAREIAKLNASNPGVRIVLGGTTIHNSKSFMREVFDSVSLWTTAGKDAEKEVLSPQTGGVQRTARIG
ncbi:vacuolar protein sorting-associated protein 45 [Polyrhizophydium stewartii]|uniref:Vacuolar protein sorting-associated protein 45 n=1 Tax=Polyrhizophydium stewartii TaxID=2732419 RepID=A0ABR4MX54_9FUNG|nr:vacuolar protein sorting-associated protein 45 [Polyrhizophydium stewartii]